MTLNIISSFAANTALRNLQLNGDEAGKSVAKLSSGSRVVTAADDAAALSVGTRLNTEVRSLETAAVNAGQAVSLLQIADGGLNRVQELLTRMKVLAVKAGSENISDNERNLLDIEFQNLKTEIGRLTGDTKFNGVRILDTETFVQGAGVVAADTNANLGLRDFDVLSDDVGNTRGIVDISIRGVDNRAVTLGGDGEFTVTIYQGEQIIADNTGQSFQTGPADTVFAVGPVLPATVPVGTPVNSALRHRTEEIQQTNFQNIAFLPSGELEFNAARIDRDITRIDITRSWGPAGASFPVGPGSIPAQNLAITDSAATPTLIVQDATGGTPAVPEQALTFTAFFEFGDLDNNGQNDVLIKRATIDGSLVRVGEDPANPNAVTLATGVSIVFDNDDADFSFAGGISKETRKNASFVIALDPAKGPDLNLGNDALGNFEGLFEGAPDGFVQGAFNAHNADSGVVGFDFKVGSGILRDEDVVSVGVGSATLESFGIVAADIRTKTAADSAGETVSAALDYLVNLRTDVGANINRLEVAGDNIAISIENQEAARSRLLDLNVARELALFTSNQLLLDTGVSVLTQAQSLPAEALRLYG